MGRPGLLCGLCPDSRVNRRFTVGECANCFGVRFCEKHLDWHEGRWLCKRCVRKDKQQKNEQRKAS